MEKDSLNIANDKIDKLKEIFPEAFREEKIDFESLRRTLGKLVINSDERYNLDWAGKSEAFKVLQTTTTATLSPSRNEGVNFDKTENIFIEGDNLEVLKILQKSYYGKIKMIYIDPPYNTGNDSFIYPDKFQESKEEYLKRIGEKDEEGYLLKEGLFRKNSKENGHYHSNWLSMMYPRLFLARNLLRDDGVIFVSIDDNEVHNLRLIMNEIFGEENFVACFVRRQNLAGKQDSTFFANEHDYCICYCKSINSLTVNKQQSNLKGYKYDDEFKNERGCFYLRRMDDDGIHYSEKLDYPIVIQKGEEFLVFDENLKKIVKKRVEENLEIWPGGDEKDKSFTWRWSQNKLQWGIKNEFIVLKKNKKNKWGIYFKEYQFIDNNLNNINRIIPYGTFIMDFPNNVSHQGFKELFDNKKIFDYPKPIGLISYLIKIASNPNDIVLDFFAGSGTTAHSVMELNKEDGGNRKFICVQLPEKTEEDSEAYKAGYQTIAEICKERIRRVIKKMSDEVKDKNQTLDLGFKVFKLKNSNFKIWRGDFIDNEDDLEKQMDIFKESLKPEAREENIVYELLLKSGYDLNTKITLYEKDKNKFYIVADNEMVIVLSKVDEECLREIIKLKPNKVVCLDSIFEGNDQLKTNISLQMKDAEIDFLTV
ncbi:MAG: site-specific DNA-methyltransferase [Elusimicrobia bacterium]|nr:site-specific DNA-methyltransferase [Elusimicrobiota bacterium]